MRRVLAALDAHWFAPASLRELAFVRVLLFGSQTLIFLWLPNGVVRPFWWQVRKAEAYAGSYDPGLALRVLLPWTGHAPPSADVLLALYVVAVVAGILATVGLWARVSMLVAWAANLAINAHYFAYGEYHHAEATMMIALALLALGPSATAWSVDAWRRQRRTGVAPPRTSVFARWPLRLTQWVLALTYLSAAYNKISVGGLRWFNGYTMTFHYLNVALSANTHTPAYMAALPPWTHIPGAVASWLFEALFSVAVLWPPSAWLFVLAGTGMHLAIYATMGIAFFQTIVVYSVFVEAIRRHFPRVGRRRRRV
jgi:hypothetical protein